MDTLPALKQDPPLVVVISGPSGVGKTVLCERVQRANPRLVHSVSATTRPRRPEERDGVDYRFMSGEAFAAGIEAGEFLEWAEVHGHRYGTPAGPVRDQLEAGRSPLLNVDVQGGRSVQRLRPDAVLIFLAPPSWAALEKRLRGRGTEDEDLIQRRLENARRELEAWPHYDYVVVNDRLADAVAEVSAILAAERRRTRRHRAGG